MALPPHTCTRAKGISHAMQSSSQKLPATGSCRQKSSTARVSRAAGKQRGVRGQPDLQKEAQLLNEVFLGAPRVPIVQPEHGVTGQGAQQRRSAARPQQADGGRVEGVQAALELHAQHHCALAMPLLQLPQVLQQGTMQADPGRTYLSCC